jgi:hypothetical protein
LIGCFGDKHTITLARIDETPKEAKGVVRIVESKKIKTIIDPGQPGVQAIPGETIVQPGDIIITESDLVKLVNMAKKYNLLKRNIDNAVKSKIITVEISNTLLGD